MEFLRSKTFIFDSDLTEFVNNTNCKVLSITQSDIDYTLFFKFNEDNVVQ